MILPAVLAAFLTPSAAFAQAADPVGSGPIVAALGWLQGTLLGNVATAVAVMVVEAVGVMMLTGRLNWRFGATVIIGGAILGLPGILGVTLGMTTRNWIIAMILGGGIGVLTPVILGGHHSAQVPITALEYSVSTLIGPLAGLMGCAIRRIGAKV